MLNRTIQQSATRDAPGKPRHYPVSPAGHCQECLIKYFGVKFGGGTFYGNKKMDQFATLGELLGQLSSEHNAIRNAAEDQLNNHWLVNQPEALLTGLSSLVLHGTDHVR